MENDALVYKTAETQDLETLTKMSKYCMLFKYRNKILKGVMT